MSKIRLMDEVPALRDAYRQLPPQAKRQLVQRLMRKAATVAGVDPDWEADRLVVALNEARTSAATPALARDGAEAARLCVHWLELRSPCAETFHRILDLYGRLDPVQATARSMAKGRRVGTVGPEKLYISGLIARHPAARTAKELQRIAEAEATPGHELHADCPLLAENGVLINKASGKEYAAGWFKNAVSEARKIPG